MSGQAWLGSNLKGLQVWNEGMEGGMRHILRIYFQTYLLAESSPCDCRAEVWFSCWLSFWATLCCQNAKVGSQETPGITGKFGCGVRNEVGQRLIEFCQENTLVIANTLFQQHKRRLYTWTSPDGQHRNQIDYILCSPRWRSSMQSAKTRPGADYGSDHELLIAKFRFKLKKVWKTTRPFR